MGSFVLFEGNIARDGGNTNQGGAIALEESSSLRVAGNTKFANNAVVGKSPHGGAVSINVAAEARLSGATFKNNSVRVLAEYGFGGAVHVEASTLLLAWCRFEWNVALMDDRAAASGATAGGISVSNDAELTVLDTSFYANNAGGVGKHEAVGSPQAVARRVIRAAHILSEGKTVALRCEFARTAPIDLPNSAPWWIVGTARGQIRLVNSTFRGSTTGQAEGMLSLADEAAALLRSCAGSNVLVDLKVAGGKLGVVDSTFEPALGSSLRSIAPPACGTEVAGQRMCDPRAACTLRPSGGVECLCKGDGIEPPSGVRDDGAHCATVFSLSAYVATNVARFVLPKPGHHLDPLKLRVIATGEAGFNVTYRRSTVLRRDGNTVAASEDGLDTRVFGLAFEWKDMQPPSRSSMVLDPAKQQYSAAAEHTFALALHCARNATLGPAGIGSTCPQDGDTIETTITATPQAGSAAKSLRFDEVQIVTEVQASVSCERTKPTVRIFASTDFESILPNAPLAVHLVAMDVDNQPIKFSRAEFALTWDRVSVPFDWLRGRSEYSWQIPPGRDAGEHEIVIGLTGSNCTLLRLKVTVASDHTQMIVMGCIVGVVVLVLVALGFLAWKNQHRATELIFSLLSYEGVLAGEMCLETWYGCCSRMKPRSLVALCLLQMKGYRW